MPRKRKTLKDTGAESSVEQEDQSEYQVYEFCKDRLQIDMDNLDRALIQHPTLYLEVSENYAHALSLRDQSKENIESVHATLDPQVREMLHKNEGKFTETMVSAAIKTRPEYTQAVKDYQNNKMQADMWSALKSAFESRAYALRELVQLYITGYNANNAVETDRPDAREAIVDQKVKRSGVNKRKLTRNGEYRTV